MKPRTTTYLSVGTIVAMNLAIVINIYGFPSEAFYGLTSVSLYLIAMIVFLVPVALVSAELGSMYPTQGGVFTWVKNAIGYRPGVVASWLQWLQSILFYPLSLTFAAVTFSYIFPDVSTVNFLANSKIYIMLFTLVVFWVSTFIGTLGLKHIGRLSTVGVWVGIIVPVALLICFGVYYMFTGGHIEMNTDPKTLIPDFSSVDTIVLAASIMLFFSGLEVNGAHVNLMKNPSRQYPRALLLTAIIIVAIYIFGTLAISVIIPSNDLNITQSVIAAFKKYLLYIHVGKVLPVIAVALTFGVIANTITWISGPSEVVKTIAMQGYLPKAVNKQNSKGAPLFILVTQGIIVSALVSVYAIFPQVQQGYQMLIQMANAVYLTMYVILYIAFIRLRYKAPDAPRPFRAGKTKFGAWCVALLGMIGAVGTLILSFFPPAQLDLSKTNSYVFTLIVIYICLVAPPILYLLYRWIKKVPVQPIEAPEAPVAAPAATPAATKAE